jgi:phosphoadenylyl-sulfate reductase (thioredoxin)
VRPAGNVLRAFSFLVPWSGDGMASDTPGAEPVGEESAPEEIVAWTLRRFAGHELVVTTSFGMEGYALRDRLAARYPHLSFENRGTTLTPEAQAEQFGPELWRHDPDLCCVLRKVEPMRRALQGVDVWLTGLTRSQSAERAALRVVEWDWKYQLVKVNPLAAWDRARVWEYVRAHDVPYNELHERGYPTLGCTHCTVPVPGAGPRDYSRTGRWAGTSKTECGLHRDVPRHFARKA